jgi:hypothetical protein
VSALLDIIGAILGEEAALNVLQARMMRACARLDRAKADVDAARERLVRHEITMRLRNGGFPVTREDIDAAVAAFDRRSSRDYESVTAAAKAAADRAEF